MMSMRKRMLGLGTLIVLSFFPVGTSRVAFGHGGLGISPFGGEWRNPTRVMGRVLCVACTVKEVQKASAEYVPNLYIFTNGTQQAVFQVTAVGKIPSGQDASQRAYWINVTGLSKKVVIRARDDLWQSLIAAENLRKEVELTGLLRSTGAFDVALITPVDTP
jgi:hypothetical protein